MATRLQKEIKEAQQIYDAVVSGGRPEYDLKNDPEALANKEVWKWLGFVAIGVGGSLAHMIAFGLFESSVTPRYPWVAVNCCNPLIYTAHIGIIALIIRQKIINSRLKKQK